MGNDVRRDLSEVVLKDGLSNQTIASTLSSDTNGSAVDRKTENYPQVLKVVVDGQTGLGTGSDQLTFDLQDAADDGNGSADTWADTGDTIQISNGTKRNSAEFDLGSYRRHVRLKLDVDQHSQSLGADTEVSAEFVFGGLKVE